MPFKLRDAFLIVTFWLMACTVAVIIKLQTVESVAGEFGDIARRVMTVSSMFMATVVAAPHMNWKRVSAAFYTAVFAIVLELLSHFWLVPYLVSLRS